MLAIYENGNNAINSGRLSQIEVDLFGSSRLGLWQRNLDVESPNCWLFETTPMAGTNGGRASTLSRGEQVFELSNHLGNVLATVSDRKLQIQNPANTGQTLYYTADVTSATDYYPFGMIMPGRKFTSSSSSYRYGFNGKENDNEVKGEGNQQDYGMRIYDPRLGKFLSVDPLTAKFPFYTPYQFAGNRPIMAIDLDGLEPHDVNTKELKTELTPTAGAHKATTDPIAHGTDAKPWKDLINFRISNILIQPRNSNATEQTIEGAWGSQTNLDYYTVRITKLPSGIKNGGELFEAIRLNLGLFLDDKTSFGGYASDGSDTKTWQSGNPLGSIMSFDAKFEDPILGWNWNLDDASVMTSSYFKNSYGGFWTFSTLSTTGDGYHPIGGTRQFGVSSNTINGTTEYSFYIRAADRAYDAATNIFGGQTTVFKSAEVTWNAVCSNIFMYFNNNGGNALVPSTPLSKRVPWSDVKEQTKDK